MALTVNLKQCPVKKTTVPTRALAHKASMSGHTGSSVAAQPRPLGRATAFLAPALSSHPISNRLLSPSSGHLSLTDRWAPLGGNEEEQTKSGTVDLEGQECSARLLHWLTSYESHHSLLVSWSFGFLFYQETFPGAGLEPSSTVECLCSLQQALL